MQEIRASRIGKFLILFFLCSLCSCKKETFSEYPPDMISTAYHRMSDSKTFRIHGKLELNRKISGKEQSDRIETTVVSLEDPREITVKRESFENEAEKEVRFLYYDETLREDTSYLFYEDSWYKEEKEAMTEYEVPIPFDVYLLEPDSFRKVAEEEGITIVQGAISGSAIVYALQASGTLQQFALTGLTEELAKDLDPVHVKVWVEHRGGMITKLEVDMTDAVKKMATLLYDKNGVAGPQVISCTYTIDSITLNKVVELPLPKGAETALREALK